MIHLTDKAIGTEVMILVEGDLSMRSAIAYFNGLPSSPAIDVTVHSLGVDGPSQVSFTPVSSGTYTIVLDDGSIAAYVEAVPRTIVSYLKNIEDEALGSWTWNRADGTLQLLRQDGSVLANFAVVDTVTENSRERLL